MEIKIEWIKESDLDEVLGLALSTPELWDTDEPGYFSRDELVEFVKSPDDIYLKVTVDGKFAGYRFATFHPILKGGYLMDIAIKPEYRNMGLANKLYAETEKILKEKGAHYAWALVHEKNEKMQGYIEKKGYMRGRKWYTYYKEF